MLVASGSSSTSSWAIDRAWRIALSTHEWPADEVIRGPVELAPFEVLIAYD